MLGDAYEQLNAVAKILERVFTNSETAMNQMHIAQALQAAQAGADAAATMIGDVLTGGSMKNTQNMVLSMGRDAIGILFTYGMGAYEAFRRNHRPDLPTAGNLHKAVEWLRERKLARKTIKHATKGAISAPVRRITLNTREERELQRILYPLE